ncbi:MAG: 4Fe-4S binding protein [Spirochaetales bacterium]|nr:4Fe-4S binding protein [Spirochaetales bacterium]
MTLLESPDHLHTLRESLKTKRDEYSKYIIVSSGTCGRAHGSEEVFAAFTGELEKNNDAKNMKLKKTGCLGFCEKEPLVIIFPERICYCNVTPSDVPEIVKEASSGGIIDRLLYHDSLTEKKVIHQNEIPFYKYQHQIVSGNNVSIDPEEIDDYITLDGYSALEKAILHMTPEQVIREIKKSNLRGRGGGGFPAGIKWETCRNAGETPKYIIVNCDEGDPGAYMDRGVMEGNPHSVLEGLMIAGYAIGSEKGFFYIREEYPLALKHTARAIEKAKEYGLLGENILGSGFSFSVEIHRGAGAFVSGESSALMSAIEGEVGEPRSKYVHTALKGIWNKPSCLNNVETLATVPHIINNGADWFCQIGTENSKGTKIFSLVGKVNNTGLVEVPMGTTLRDIIFKIGGGIPYEKRFKAVQTGGPSGGVIPETHLDVPIDFDELNKLGSMMGSGGMIVMDEETCMVDVAYYFIDFLCTESCGKCVPCREGLKRLKEILGCIIAGKGKEEDIRTIEGLGRAMQDASLCALGRTAANPVLSTISYFHNEYLEHIRNKNCPALVCKPLLSYYIDPKKCKACMVCLKKCPVNAIEGGKNQVHKINQEKCNQCGTCFTVCPEKFRAVRKISGRDRLRQMEQEEKTRAGERHVQ